MQKVIQTVYTHRLISTATTKLYGYSTKQGKKTQICLCAPHFQCVARLTHTEPHGWKSSADVQERHARHQPMQGMAIQYMIEQNNIRFVSRLRSWKNVNISATLPGRTSSTPTTQHSKWCTVAVPATQSPILSSATPTKQILASDTSSALHALLKRNSNVRERSHADFFQSKNLQLVHQWMRWQCQAYVPVLIITDVQSITWTLALSLDVYIRTTLYGPIAATVCSLVCLPIQLVLWWRSIAPQDWIPRLPKIFKSCSLNIWNAQKTHRHEVNTSVGSESQWSQNTPPEGRSGPEIIDEIKLLLKFSKNHDVGLHWTEAAVSRCLNQMRLKTYTLLPQAVIRRQPLHIYLNYMI